MFGLGHSEINFFHGFAGTGFLERISLAIPAEKDFDSPSFLACARFGLNLD